MTDTPEPIAGSPEMPDVALARWPGWKILLAYAVMFAVALGSIWLIDGHVMKLSEELAREAGR